MERTFYLLIFNDTATTEIYTLSLHDALPIYEHAARGVLRWRGRHAVHLPHPHRPGGAAPARHSRLHTRDRCAVQPLEASHTDRKSTRLNSSHANISYAVFCLKKKTTLHHSHA